MCEPKPGLRCAAETGGVCQSTSSEYEAAHPDGPAVGTLDRAEASFGPADPGPLTRADLLVSRDPERIRAFTGAYWAGSNEAFQGYRPLQEDEDAKAKIVTAAEGSIEDVRAAALAHADAAYAHRTFRMEYDVTSREMSELGTHAWSLENGPDAVIERVTEYETSDPGLGNQQYIPQYLHELDREVDDGRLDTHPWRNPARTAFVNGLKKASLGRGEAATAAEDQLAVLRSRVLPQRAEVEARKAGTGSPQAAYRDRIRAAEAALAAHLPPSVPSPVEVPTPPAVGGQPESAALPAEPAGATRRSVRDLFRRNES